MEGAKLKDPSGMFYDAETGFRVVGRAVEPLKPPIGRLTREWLTAGGLVLVKFSEEKSNGEAQKGGCREDNPTDASPSDEGEVSLLYSPSSIQNADGDHTELREADLRELPISELRRLAKERGIALKRGDNAEAIIAKLLFPA